MKKVVKRYLGIAVMLIIAICPLLQAEVFAGETRGDIVWIDAKSDDIVTLNLNVYKSRRDSYGMEFTAPNNTDDPKNFTSGNYSGQGMIRLARTDELIFRTGSGRWIGAGQEQDDGLTRVAFSRNEWHWIKVEFNRAELTMTWYLDGELLGTTPATNGNPINAISVFCDSVINDGLEIIAVTETTEAEASLAATDTYKYVFRNTQGTNNWYFCEFGNYTERELTYNDGQWRAVDEGAYIGRGVFHPGNMSDVGVKYIAHKNGIVRLNGVVQAKEADCIKGDGVVAEIYVGDKRIWRSEVTYGNDASYNITSPVKQGEAVSFRINKNGSLSYDWTSWTPTVEYIDAEYSFSPDNYRYYQKNIADSSTKNLTYNAETKIYEGDGGYFDGHIVSPNEGFLLGKSFSALQDGRYRIYGIMTNGSMADVTVNVKKNGEEIWSQLFPKCETGSLDIRAYLVSGDSVDIEIVFVEQGLGETVHFDVDVEKIVGTMYCDESTSQGYSYGVIEEYLLSDLIGTAQGENGMSYYFIYKDKKQEMIYNSENQRWENTDGSSGGYISKTAGYSGAYTDTVMEWSVPKDGTLRIDGDLFITDTGDGTLCRIYKNDEIVWTNRVGGERLVRWDEPYDTSYFSNRVNVVIPVNEDDKISILFDQWRMAMDDPADFSNVKFSYIDGSILSETTKWKLNKSVVFDLENKEIHTDGAVYKADVYNDSENVYISGKSANEVFGTSIASENADEYILLKDIVNETGKNMVELENKLAIVYDGLPMMYGYAELGELNSMLNPVKDTDLPVRYCLADENGNEITESVAENTRYFVQTEAENFVGESYDTKLILAEYNSDGALLNIRTLAEFEIKVGTEYTSKNDVSFTVSGDIGYVRLFVWNGIEEINPLAESTKFNVIK